MLLSRRPRESPRVTYSAMRYRSVVRGLLILSVRKLWARFRRPVHSQSRASKSGQPSSTGRLPKGSAPAVAAVSGVSERRLSALHWLQRLRESYETPPHAVDASKPLLNQAIGLHRRPRQRGDLNTKAAFLVAALECRRKSKR